MGWGGANRPKVSSRVENRPANREGADGDIQIKGTGLGAKLFAKWSGRWWDVPLSIDGVTKFGLTDSDYLSIDRDSVDIFKDSIKVAEFGQDTVITGGSITLRGTTGTTGDEKLVLEDNAISFYSGGVEVLDINGTNATVTVGRVAAGQSNILISSGTLQLRNNTDVMIELNTDGSATIVGDVTIGGTSLTTTADNVFIGDTTTAAALITDDHSIENIAIGTKCMQTADYAKYNVFLGYLAAQNFGDGNSSSEAFGNVGIGYSAYKMVSSPDVQGNYNNVIGFSAMMESAGGDRNVCMGYNAGRKISANSNTCIGDSAGYASATTVDHISSGTNNICISAGSDANGARPTATDVNYSISIGYYARAALDSIAIGETSLASGEQSVTIGNDTVCSQDESVVIGSECEVTGYTKSIAIGHNIVSSSSGANSIGIGNDFTVSSNGRVQLGFGTSSAYADPGASGTVTWTGGSDRRLKKNIVRDGIGLDFINDLHPSIFEYRAPSEMDKDFSEYDSDNHKRRAEGKDYGFIAQEVKKVVDKYDADYFRICSQFDNSDIQGLATGALVVPLTKAVQELSAKLDTMQTEINNLKAE